MSLLLGSLIAGGIASAVGTGVNMWENHKNRKFSAAEAQKQRDWETQMSNTAVQRSVEDMQKAGINPAMAFGGGAGGGGASTPNGAAAHATGSSNIAVNMINSAANLAAAFNMDKDKSNNVNLNQITKATAYMQKNGIKDLNKSTFTDLDKVKI